MKKQIEWVYDNWEIFSPPNEIYNIFLKTFYMTKHGQESIESLSKEFARLSFNEVKELIDADPKNEISQVIKYLIQNKKDIYLLFNSIKANLFEDEFYHETLPDIIKEIDFNIIDSFLPNCSTIIIKATLNHKNKEWLFIPEHMKNNKEALFVFWILDRHSLSFQSKVSFDTTSNGKYIPDDKVDWSLNIEFPSFKVISSHDRYTTNSEDELKSIHDLNLKFKNEFNGLIQIVELINQKKQIDFNQLFNHYYKISELIKDESPSKAYIQTYSQAFSFMNIWRHQMNHLLISDSTPKILTILKNQSNFIQNYKENTINSINILLKKENIDLLPITALDYLNNTDLFNSITSGIFKTTELTDAEIIRDLLLTQHSSNDVDKIVSSQELIEYKKRKEDLIKNYPDFNKIKKTINNSTDFDKITRLIYDWKDLKKRFNKFKTITMKFQLEKSKLKITITRQFPDHNLFPDLFVAQLDLYLN